MFGSRRTVRDCSGPPRLRRLKNWPWHADCAKGKDTTTMNMKKTLSMLAVGGLVVVSLVVVYVGHALAKPGMGKPGSGVGYDMVMDTLDFPGLGPVSCPVLTDVGLPGGGSSRNWAFGTRNSVELTDIVGCDSGIVIGGRNGVLIRFLTKNGFLKAITAEGNEPQVGKKYGEFGRTVEIPVVPPIFLDDVEGFDFDVVINADNVDFIRQKGNKIIGTVSVGTLRFTLR